MARAFGVISLEDWVLRLRFSNLRVKFAKQEVMVSIIFITSPILESTSYPFDCLRFPLPLKVGIPQCLKLVAIRSSVSSDSTMVAKMLSLRTSL